MVPKVPGNRIVLQGNFYEIERHIFLRREMIEAGLQIQVELISMGQHVRIILSLERRITVVDDPLVEFIDLRIC